MKTFVLLLCFNIIINTPITKSVSVLKKTNEIIAKNKIEMKSEEINCVLNEIILAFVPVIPEKNPIYYLHKPSGDYSRLNITKAGNINLRNFIGRGDQIKINYTKHGIKTIWPSFSYSVYNLNLMKKKPSDSLENEIVKSDLAIGPLQMEDHGNWILSIYYLDTNEEWVELFQVISIIIREKVPTNHGHYLFVDKGSNFTFGFNFAIREIISCELTAPRSTYDRFYTRNNIDFNYCSYFISNVTEEDEGFWTVIGAGKIIYEGSIYLTVN